MITTKVLSLVIVRNNGSVLLGMKKRGFGIGKWNGFGGKIENGESIEQCAKRELKEESGISVDHLEEVGRLKYDMTEDREILKVHVFTSSKFHGEPHESEEMRPQWFRENEIPFSKMWTDDKYWYPIFLKGAKFKGYFNYSDSETIIQWSIEEVPSLEVIND